MRISSRKCGGVLLVLALSALSQISYGVTINFDDVADGTIIDTQYVGLGVTFSSVSSLTGDAYARSITGPDSSPNGVSLIAPFDPGSGTGSIIPYFDARDGAVKAAFSTLQSSVSIDAKPVMPPEFTPPVNNKPFLEAFDSSDNFLGGILYPLNYGDPGWNGSSDAGIWETLTVTSATDDIAYVLFSSQNSQAGAPVYGAFDNLTFGESAPGPGPEGAVPEPATLSLLAVGLAALASRCRRARRRMA